MSHFPAPQPMLKEGRDSGGVMGILTNKSFKCFFYSVVFAVAGSAWVYGEPLPELDLLSRRRSMLTFPEYSTEQKRQVLGQIRKLLAEMYVNRELKEKQFGFQIDEMIQAIEQTLPSLDDNLFHRTLSRLFFSLKDPHTNYYFPKPYSCFTSALPLTLREGVTKIGGNTHALWVASLTLDEKILALAPEISKLSVGDEVILYQRTPILEAQEKIFPETDRINLAGLRGMANVLLTSWDHKKYLVPIPDEVALKMKRPDGTEYEVILPWLSKLKPGCLPGQPVAPTAANIASEAPTPVATADLSHILPTAEPTIKYKRISTERGDFGYLLITSFTPKAMNFTKALLLIKELFEENFLGTQGVLLDLRSNNGGNIQYAESIPQLWSPRSIETNDYILKASKTVFDWMTHWVNPTLPNPLEFAESVKAAYLEGRPYSSAVKTTPLSMANSIGRVYSGPVIVLTNGACISACETILATLQDLHLAKIIGEDFSTTGGGASVTEHSGIIKVLPNPGELGFSALPGGQDMRVSLRQTHRIGAHAGELFEGIGILVDEVIAPTLEDVTVFDAHLVREIVSRF